MLYDIYKTTTIRVKKTDLNILKDIAKEDNRSLNYIINKIIIEYITTNPRLKKDIIIDDNKNVSNITNERIINDITVSDDISLYTLD